MVMYAQIPANGIGGGPAKRSDVQLGVKSR